MAKYHITGKGEPGVCTAQAGNCPLGEDSEHYETTIEARAAFEKFMADDAWGSVSKKTAPQNETLTSASSEIPSENSTASEQDPTTYEVTMLETYQVPVTETAYRPVVKKKPRVPLGGSITEANKDIVQPGERYEKDGRVYEVDKIKNWDALEMFQAFGNYIHLREVYSDGRRGPTMESADPKDFEGMTRTSVSTVSTTPAPTFSKEIIDAAVKNYAEVQKLGAATNESWKRIAVARDSFIIGRNARVEAAEKDHRKMSEEHKAAENNHRKKFGAVIDAQKAGLLPEAYDELKMGNYELNDIPKENRNVAQED